MCPTQTVSPLTPLRNSTFRFNRKTILFALKDANDEIDEIRHCLSCGGGVMHPHSGLLIHPALTSCDYGKTKPPTATISLSPPRSITPVLTCCLGMGWWRAGRTAGRSSQAGSGTRGPRRCWAGRCRAGSRSSGRARSPAPRPASSGSW